MRMIIACIFSFVFGMFTVIGYDEWHHWRRAKRAAQAELERRISEPTPQPGTMARPNYSAIHVLDQVDRMIKRMDDAEMDELIDEMQMRGW